MDEVHFLENQTECWLAKTADLMIIAKTPAKIEKKTWLVQILQASIACTL